MKLDCRGMNRRVVEVEIGVEVGVVAGTVSPCSEARGRRFSLPEGVKGECRFWMSALISVVSNDTLRALLVPHSSSLHGSSSP